MASSSTCIACPRITSATCLRISSMTAAGTRSWYSRAPSTVRIAWRSNSSRAGIRTAAIHGNKSQAARVRALADFKANKVTALVATEVASRGLDIKELPQVVNYELPNVPEDYVHRIGRTARAGATGRAVSLVSPDETSLLRDIERLLKRSLPVAALPAYEVRQPQVAAPTADRRLTHSPSRTSSAPARHRGDSRRWGRRNSRH